MDSKTTQKILKKVKEDYKVIASDFNISRKKMFWQELNILVEKYVKEDQKILDIGCGNGRLFLVLKDKNIKYLGIDNCKELIDLAREEFRDYKNTDFKIKDLLNVNNNKEFDVVFVIAVLQHIPAEELRLDALRKIKKALKPNGYLIMLNWNLFQKDKIKYVRKYNNLRKEDKFDLEENDTLIPWREFRGGYQNKNKENKEILRYYHAFTKEEIMNLLKKAGFSVEDIYYAKKGERVGIEKGYNLCAVAKNI